MFHMGQPVDSGEADKRGVQVRTHASAIDSIGSRRSATVRLLLVAGTLVGALLLLYAYGRQQSASSLVRTAGQTISPPTVDEQTSPPGMDPTHTKITAGNEFGYVDLTAISDAPNDVPFAERIYPDNLPGYKVTDSAGKTIGYYRAIDDGTDKCTSTSPCGHYVFVDLNGNLPKQQVP